MEKEIKMYKCYIEDGSYRIMFSDDGKRFNKYSDFSGLNYNKSKFTKVETLETDTLQEVERWCNENRKGVAIGVNKNIYIAEFTVNPIEKSFYDVQDLLHHIRNTEILEDGIYEIEEVDCKRLVYVKHGKWGVHSSTIKSHLSHLVNPRKIAEMGYEIKNDNHE